MAKGSKKSKGGTLGKSHAGKAADTTCGKSRKVSEKGKVASFIKQKVFIPFRIFIKFNNKIKKKNFNSLVKTSSA